MPQPGDAVPILQSEEDAKDSEAAQGSKTSKFGPRDKSDYASMKRLMSPIFNALKRFEDKSVEPVAWRKIESRVSLSRCYFVSTSHTPTGLCSDPPKFGTLAEVFNTERIHRELQDGCSSSER